jgi:S-adenosylhomocysteine hydrolase
MISRAITLATGLALLSACANTSVTLERKMATIRREQCDPLPTQPQRAACIQQVNNIEDDALRQLEEARRQQVIQQTVDQVRVINQTGRQW